GMIDGGEENSSGKKSPDNSSCLPDTMMNPNRPSAEKSNQRPPAHLDALLSLAHFQLPFCSPLMPAFLPRHLSD
ncbi:hypothetical protein E3U43_020004, partial [Larimichthys crocea]